MIEDDNKKDGKVIAVEIDDNLLFALILFIVVLLLNKIQIDPHTEQDSVGCPTEQPTTTSVLQQGIKSYFL